MLCPPEPPAPDSTPTRHCSYLPPQEEPQPTPCRQTQACLPLEKGSAPHSPQQTRVTRDFKSCTPLDPGCGCLSWHRDGNQGEGDQPRKTEALKARIYHLKGDSNAGLLSWLAPGRKTFTGPLVPHHTPANPTTSFTAPSDSEDHVLNLLSTAPGAEAEPAAPCNPASGIGRVMRCDTKALNSRQKFAFPPKSHCFRGENFKSLN